MGNSRLNRYQNIVPYDVTRVKLKEPIFGMDYINASWITTSSHNQNNSCLGTVSFIASQGPTLQSCAHHLQLLHENNVDIVVMLSSIMEGSGQGRKQKCEQYWPTLSQKDLSFDHMKIEITKETKTSDHLIERCLKIENNNSAGKSHKVIHFQYTGWPDLDAPTTTEPIISLVKKVRRELVQMNKNGHNVLVHCSACVGRTGTFIALYQLMDFLDDTLLHNPRNSNGEFDNTIDIFSTVLQLRSKRMFMVQAFAQYKYLHACVASYAKEVQDLKDSDNEVVDANNDVQRRNLDDIYVYMP